MTRHSDSKHREPRAPCSLLRSGRDHWAMLVLARQPLPALTYRLIFVALVPSSVLADRARSCKSEKAWGLVTDSQGLFIFILITVEGWRGRTAAAASVVMSTMSRFQRRRTPMTGDLPLSCPLPLSAARPPTPRFVHVGVSSHHTAGSHCVLGTFSVIYDI